MACYTGRCQEMYLFSCKVDYLLSLAVDRYSFTLVKCYFQVKKVKLVFVFKPNKIRSQCQRTRQTTKKQNRYSCWTVCLCRKCTCPLKGRCSCCVLVCGSLASLTNSQHSFSNDENKVCPTGSNYQVDKCFTYSILDTSQQYTCIIYWYHNSCQQSYLKDKYVSFKSKTILLTMFSLDS